MSGQPAVLQVVILQGGLLVGTEVFVPGHYVIGSGQGVDLHLCDPTVEPTHASLFFQNGRAAIQNTGSGVVFVNGHRVKACEVRAIDEIVLGPFTLKLRVLIQRPRTWATPPPEIAAIFDAPFPGPLAAQGLSGRATTAAPHLSATVAEDAQANANEPESLDVPDRFSERPSPTPPASACSSEGAMSAKDAARMLASGPLVQSARARASAPAPLARPPATATPPVPAPRASAPRDSAPRVPAPRDSAPGDSVPRVTAPRDSAPRVYAPPPAEGLDLFSEGAVSAKEAAMILVRQRSAPSSTPQVRPAAAAPPPLPGPPPPISAPSPVSAPPPVSAPRVSAPPSAESLDLTSDGAMSAKEAAMMLARLRSASSASAAADRPAAAAAPAVLVPRNSARQNGTLGRVVTRE